MKLTSNTSPLGRAIAIAAEAHQSQVDKAGQAYILHPMRMMLRSQNESEQIVAILHDLIEDTNWTLERLSVEGFPSEILAAIECLTNRDGESYEAFIDRVMTNPLAARVKRYDIEDNMNLIRLATVTERDLQRLAKYHTAYLRLREFENASV